MESYIKTEGIVLQALPFKERDQILTLFTPYGLLKLFIKGRQKAQSALMVPLTAGEYLYKLGKHDLHQFFDGTVLNQHYKIRDRYESLATAQALFQCLLYSQWLGKPAPRLYLLLCHFLEHMAALENPSRLASIFMLKILNHEGILQLGGGCVECGKISEKRCRGECYCFVHAPSHALVFNEHEEILLKSLAEGRSLKSVAALDQDCVFKEKISALFHQSFG